MDSDMRPFKFVEGEFNEGNTQKPSLEEVLETLKRYQTERDFFNTEFDAEQILSDIYAGRDKELRLIPVRRGKNVQAS